MSRITFSFAVKYDESELFFTPIHTSGGLDDWISISVSLPMSISPRPGFENGIVGNVSDYLSVFYPNTEIVGIPDEAENYIQNYMEEIFHVRSSDRARVLCNARRIYIWSSDYGHFVRIGANEAMKLSVEKEECWSLCNEDLMIGGPTRKRNRGQ